MTILVGKFDVNYGVCVIVMHHWLLFFRSILISLNQNEFKIVEKFEKS